MRINDVDVRRGDKVWSPIFGWGLVRGANCDQIMISFNAVVGLVEIQANNRAPGGHQYLYWDEIDMSPPQKPKEMVKKYLVCFKNNATNGYHVSKCYYNNRDEFERKVRCGTFIHLIKESEQEWEDEGD